MSREYFSKGHVYGWLAYYLYQSIYLPIVVVEVREIEVACDRVIDLDVNNCNTGNPENVICAQGKNYEQK